MIPRHLIMSFSLRFILPYQYFGMQLGSKKYPLTYNETLCLTASCINDIKPYNITDTSDIWEYYRILMGVI